MGCDIHGPYIEVKRSGVWDLYDEREWDRAYGDFAVLANVRNYGAERHGEELHFIARPKGLPADVSKRVQGASDYLGPNGHSHSYLTAEELTAFDWDRETPTHEEYREIAPQAYEIMKELRALRREVGECRIVFWFDS